MVSFSLFRRTLPVALLAVTLGGCATHTGRATAEGAAASNAVTTPDSVAQTSWILTRWSAGDSGTVRHPATSSTGLPLHLDFLVRGNDYRVAGFSGCNRFMGTYKMEQGRLIITAPAATRMACASAEDGALERDFLKALASISRFTLDSGGAPRKMTLALSGGDTLEFTRGEDPPSKP